MKTIKNMTLIETKGRAALCLLHSLDALCVPSGHGKLDIVQDNGLTARNM